MSGVIVVVVGVVPGKSAEEGEKGKGRAEARVEDE